jgi:hypothetical protein
MKSHSISGILLFLSVTVRGDELALPHFRAVEIDSHIEIGYAVTVADVDGDRKPDILVVDKKQIVWYRNPTWEKFVIAENLTTLDNVCIAAADLDGDGKAEVAVGAGWNPGDTVNSGAVFYLVAPADRTKKWEPVELAHEPTVHRMRWWRTPVGAYELVVVPLHGRGNQAGAGAGVKILGYQMPSDPHKPWTTEVIDDSLHMTHNFELLKPGEHQGTGMLVAAREGIFRLIRNPGGWERQQIIDGGFNGPKSGGAGEVRMGKLPEGIPFIATVEPMHGTNLVVYSPAQSANGKPAWKGQLLDSTLREGHALACGDLAGTGYDQVVIGWRVKNSEGKVGIKVFAPRPEKRVGEPVGWTQELVDDNTMACEDLCLADLNGDGKLDIVASGRATKNVKIYFNEGGPR